MIGIRSAQLGADGATLHLRAGGGIVADSMPDAEAAEANVKLAAVLDAVVPGAAERLR
jgi:isochorismate synthase EntC